MTSAGMGQPRLRISPMRGLILLLTLAAVALAVTNARRRVSTAAAAISPDRASDAPASAPQANQPVWSFTLAGDPFNRGFHDPAPQSRPVAKAPAAAPARGEPVEAEAARTLRLSSVVTGASAHAVINGRVMRVGESVAGFVIREIRPRSVIVEKAEVRIEVHP